MIRKIILISIFFSLLAFCGKKEDPEYKAKRQDVIIKKI